jgi:tetratricopeptide (TPR) repeat protein
VILALYGVRCYAYSAPARAASSKFLVTALKALRHSVSLYEMNQAIKEMIQRADALYDARENVENVRASLRLLQEGDYGTSQYEALWRAGRALFFLGQEAAKEDEKRDAHARAVSICKPAARAKPLRVEGHFWLGVNLALLAEVENPIKALLDALSARRALMRAVQLDPAFHAAGPLRVLARLQHKLPRTFGGGPERARINFERAIRLAPANTVTRLYFAEMLLEIGERERARSELMALLDATPDARWIFESARDRQRAQRMLVDI